MVTIRINYITQAWFSTDMIIRILLRFMNHDRLNKNPSAQNSNYHNDSSPKFSLRDAYTKYEVDEYYEKFGDSYHNPHGLIVDEVIQLTWQKWSQNWSSQSDLIRDSKKYLDLEEDLGGEQVLDLACGSGEVTLALEKMGVISVDAIDPFTYKIYQERTGRIAQRFTFNDIANGVLAGRKYRLIICSFALHLVPISRLPLLLYQLGLISNYLIVITPHKRPEIKPNYGWLWVEEINWKRVRARLYYSPVVSSS